LEHCVFSIFIVLVKKKNKWDEITRVIYTGRSLPQKKSGPIGQRRMGRGCVQIGEQAVDAVAPSGNL
jgi:hypothetical protein